MRLINGEDLGEVKTRGDLGWGVGGRGGKAILGVVTGGQACALQSEGWWG